MDFEFVAETIEWRGPAPFYYLRVPERESADIRELAPEVSYGWGVIPVRARAADTEWSTSLFPKDGRYLVPVKAVVRATLGIEPGDEVTLSLTLGR